MNDEDFEIIKQMQILNIEEQKIFKEEKLK